MEVVVSYVVDEHAVDRRVAALAIGGGIFVLGIPSAYDLVLLDLFDLFADQILLVLGGLLLAILVGWILSDLAVGLSLGIGDLGGYGTAWIWAVRIPVVLVLIVALVLGFSIISSS